MSVEKTTARVFRISEQVPGDGWANITIDRIGPLRDPRDREPFSILIESDYGSWSNHWSHPGDCWRSFLIGIDIYYAAGKFGSNKYYDADATQNAYKSQIYELRKNGEIDAVQARDMWDQVDAEFMASDSSDVVADRLMSGEWEEVLNNIGRCSYEYVQRVVTIEPGFKSFWNGPWKEFLQSLKEELAEVVASEDPEEVMA